MDFATGELHGAATLSFGTFRLQRGSGVALHPETFGVRIADDRQPLAIELAYEPRPAHAEDARQGLRAEVLRRARFQTLPLCIDAHTLLYLHHAGAGAMASEYYAPPAKVNARGKLARRMGQTITETAESQILLYDYELDRAAELSPLALWILEQLDRPRAARDLARRLAKATGEPQSEVLPVVTEITNALVARGMLSAG
jgi:hypothetical protein